MIIKYYLIKEETFASLDKDAITFKINNLEGDKRIIATTQIVNDRIRKFNNIDTCSNFTFTNHIDWVGDGTGISVDEIQTTEYIKELDN
jgi:hypothetical protein